MTKNQINKVQSREMVKFNLAIKIRELLDEAKKEYGAQDWIDEDVETRIQELVFEE